MKKSRKKLAAGPAAGTASQAAAVNGADPGISYVVGIGASAGGLEAFEQFFSRLPPDTGLVFILVPHLEPTHKGMMPELLARHTKMKVVEAKDGMHVCPNNVYVIPPNTDLGIIDGRLQVLEPLPTRGLRTPIDSFLRHLAEDQKEKAIGIILSGMGSDGTLGVRAIKEELGMVMVQEPSAAKYDGMPRSAIQTGVVDYVAPAEDLPLKLIQYVKHLPQPLEDRETFPAETPTAIQKIFLLLRTRRGNDFSCYKRSTVNRRIERRMGVHQFNNLGRYARFLQENPQEVELLYRELLIGVTGFFRDAGLFEVLKEHAFPELLRERQSGPLRIWNPACSTGEETYSLAIVLKECLERMPIEDRPAIQIFATDIDTESIDKARQGAFAVGIAADVSPERLQRFFVQEGEGYRIKKDIRDQVVFAPQNLLADPPFTKIDILCCRNLLIYLNSDAQKKLLPLMHYALNPSGLLVLGTAESTSGFGHLFSPVDTKWKVFRRLEVSEHFGIEMPAFAPPRMPRAATTAERMKGSDMDVLYAAQRGLLDLYGPPAVIVNADGDIVYFNARTGKYLESASGKVNLNVFAMAREGLREDLGVAVHKAASRKTPVTIKGVKVKTNGDWVTINLTARPLPEMDAARGLVLVVFEEALPPQPGEAPESFPALADGTLPPSELEDELRRTRERLQVTIQEMQATQEELRSANEELQSSNEELQSSNEELNSSKEEMQSLNEEMQTVNAELQTKMEELSQSNSDMKNLLNGIEIATIFLDNDLGVKRFTPEATKIVNLVTSDVGRPLSHFSTNLKYDALVSDAREVLDKLVPREAQVEAHDGSWYNLRILPYRTVDNLIDGVVMTFADITGLKQLEASLRKQHAELRSCRDCAEHVVAAVREPAVVLDGDLRIVAASRAFYQTFLAGASGDDGRPIYELGRVWEGPGFRQLVEEVLIRDAHVEGFRLEGDFPEVGHRVLLVNARRMAGYDQHLPFVFLAIEDVTPKSGSAG